LAREQDHCCICLLWLCRCFPANCFILSKSRRWTRSNHGNKCLIFTYVAPRVCLCATSMSIHALTLKSKPVQFRESGREQGLVLVTAEGW